MPELHNPDGSVVFLEGDVDLALLLDRAPGVSDAPADGRPLLLLDVDGVLYPFQAGGASVPAAAEHLTELRSAFHVVWATLREGSANVTVGPGLGLPRLPVIYFDHGFATGETWKLPAVVRDVGDRPLAWIDDDLHADAHQWAEQRSVPTLLVDTDPHVGMTRGHVDRLLSFARGTMRGQVDT